MGPGEAVRLADVEGLPDVDVGVPISVPAGRDGWADVTPGSESGEPLVSLTGSPVMALHTYRRRGWPHTTVEMWVRAEVRDRLEAIAASLPTGFGLAVFDAWRSPALQRALYDDAYGSGVLAPGFVADPETGTPPHTTGGTVDLTLCFEGHPLALGSAFDEFTEQAYADAFERPSAERRVRDLRRLLWHAMHDGGFRGHRLEWWHYSFGNQEWADGAEYLRCKYLATTPP